MMISNLIAAFGGGVLGACIGALPVFILTGIVAIAGGVVTLAGGADLSVGSIAFGSILGPHIAFAGGVAAAAYSANKKKDLDAGTNILASLNGFEDSATLLVGGIFGVFGFLLSYLYGDILKIPTDIPAISVFTLAIITRLILGTSGLRGRDDEDCERAYFKKGKSLGYSIVFGGGIGIAISYVGYSLLASGVSSELLGIYPVICFGISATALIFTQTGFATPATHHITLPAAAATIMSGNPIVGVIFAIIGTLLGDLAANVLNTNCDSHIDPPATSIMIVMLVINLLF
ncbi:MAG: hypothetical protein GX053_10095 [Tissierella sp.]|nr:hypothetical protein [Tissierella sp.]